MPTPTLTTARLTLRGHQTSDFRDCVAMWADPIVVRHIGGRQFTEEETWTKVLRYAGHWALLGFGYWVIRETATERFVGEAGFADFHRHMTPSIEGVPEIGWALASWAHGKGFATEAVQAAIAWGDGHFPVRRTVCLIDPANTASVRVAEKCGYTEYARSEYKGTPTILFER
jgi:RimJ/RimL family protein N-acetyltransferase